MSDMISASYRITHGLTEGLMDIISLSGKTGKGALLAEDCSPHHPTFRDIRNVPNAPASHEFVRLFCISQFKVLRRYDDVDHNEHFVTFH